MIARDLLDDPVTRPAPPRYSAIYIAGPMTGLPENNYPAFHEVAEKWRALGWHVENPAETYDPDDPQHPQIPYTTFLRSGLQQLVCGCEAIALMPGWESSTGATREAAVARWLGMAFYDAITMMPIRTPDHLAN